jgi:hypothetical protein
MCHRKDATAGGVPRKEPGLHYKPFGASGRSLTAFFLRNLRAVLAHFFQNPPSIESWASPIHSNNCIETDELPDRTLPLIQVDSSAQIRVIRGQNAGADLG